MDLLNDFFFLFQILSFECAHTHSRASLFVGKKCSKMFLKINWSVKNGVTLCDIGLVCDLLTPGYGLLNKQSVHTLLLNMHGWTLMDSKGYVKIMLKKKLNPIVPKNRKFVISLQNWKKEGKQKKLKMLILKKLWKSHYFFHDSSPLFKENLTQWINFLLIILCPIRISMFINADCTEIYYVNVILRIFYA